MRKRRTAPKSVFSRADNRSAIFPRSFVDDWDELAVAFGQLVAAVVRSIPPWLLRYTPFAPLARGGVVDNAGAGIATIHDDQVVPPGPLTERIRGQQRAEVGPDAPIQVVVCGANRPRTPDEAAALRAVAEAAADRLRAER